MQPLLMMAGGLLMPAQALMFESLIITLWSDHQDCYSVNHNILLWGCRLFGTYLHVLSHLCIQFTSVLGAVLHMHCPCVFLLQLRCHADHARELCTMSMIRDKGNI